MGSTTRSPTLNKVERCLGVIGCLVTLIGFVAVGRGLAAGHVPTTAIGAACTPVGLLAFIAFLCLHYNAGRSLTTPLHVSRQREPIELVVRSERRTEPQLAGCDAPAVVNTTYEAAHSLHI